MTEKEAPSFNVRLMKAMESMENPTKEKQAYKYKYETLEQMLGIVRPALANHGIGMTQGQHYDERSGGWVLETCVFDDTNHIVLDVRPIPVCSDAQSAGSWETYMRRYALRTAFGLTGEDDDGEATLSKNEGVMRGARVTEMASDKQMSMIHAKLEQLAKLRGATKEDAANGLLRKVKADSLDNLTKRQASDAITLLITWLDKAQPNDELHDEEVKF